MSFWQCMTLMNSWRCLNITMKVERLNMKKNYNRNIYAFISQLKPPKEPYLSSMACSRFSMSTRLGLELFLTDLCSPWKNFSFSVSSVNTRLEYWSASPLRPSKSFFHGEDEKRKGREHHQHSSDTKADP